MDGIVDGTLEAISVGDTVNGTCDGDIDGISLELYAGKFVGTPVVELLGVLGFTKVGTRLGLPDGNGKCLDGALLCLVIGFIDGRFEETIGLSVGCRLGFFVTDPCLGF